MLTTERTSEQDLLARISQARKPEPQVEPTGEAQEQDVQQELDEQPTEAIEDEAEVEELETSEGGDSQEQDEANDLFIEIDGEEIALSDVKQWREGNLRQSDYTKKTQALAEERKSIEKEKASLHELKADLANQRQQLEAIIAESTLSDDQLQELKEDDPQAYIEYQEKMQKRKSLLKKSTVNTADRDSKLALANDWMKDGKITEKYEQDMRLIQSYVADTGYTQQELQDIANTGDIHHWTTLIDAAKGREAIKELAKIKQSAETKRTRNPATVTKPKGKGPTNLDRQIEEAQKRFKQTGKVEDAFKLRKLKQMKSRG